MKRFYIEHMYELYCKEEKKGDGDRKGYNDIDTKTTRVDISWLWAKFHLLHNLE